MKNSALILCLTALWLAGCTVPVETATPAVTPVTPISAAPAQISAARAVALFDAVCGASLPGFANASALMAANGITMPSPRGTPTMFSLTEDVSFQLQDGPGQGRTCSMVFGTTDAPQQTTATFATMGQFVETPLGPGTIYRNTTAVVLIGGSTPQGRVTLFNLRLLSDR